MKPYPQIKITHLNLELVTEKALITTIDIFGFMYREGYEYVDVFIGDDDPDYVDGINIETNTLTAAELESISLKWMSEHVKLVKDID